MIRRDFLTTLTASPALLGAVQPLVRANAANVATGVITTSALAHDAVMLAAYASNALSDQVKRVLVKRLDVVVLGRMLEGREGALPQILAPVRGKKLDPAGETGQRIALAAGWAIHSAAVRHMGSLAGERGLYQDAAVLRSYAPSAVTATAAQVENLLEVLDRRLLIFVHTFEPDEEDVWGWLDRVADWHDGASARRRAFAAAYASPDPAKLRQHVTARNFLASADPLFQAARAAAWGEQPGRTAIAQMIDSASKQSLYTRALADAYRGLEELGRRL